MFENFCDWMKPTIVVSDVHEMTHWKEFAARRRPGDRMVFLGDYFDRRGRGPYAPCIDNFEEICAYARANPDTHLLVGNHDFQYTPFARWAPEPWDHREGMIRQALMENLDILDMVFVDDAEDVRVTARDSGHRAIFSHGGVTNSFMRNCGLSDPAEINRLWREKPELFEWMERDPEKGWRSRMDGDDPWQPPTWARYKALAEDGIRGYSQIVGHTPVPMPQFPATQYGDDTLMTCTLDDQFIRIGADCAARGAEWSA